MVVEDLKSGNIHVRVDGSTKDVLDRLLLERNLTQQGAMLSLVKWFLAQERMVQGMILGHIEKEYEQQVAEIVLARMAKSPRSRADRSPGR